VIVGAPKGPVLLEEAAPGGAWVAWADVEARGGGVALSCSLPWVRAWVRHYGDAVGHRLLVARRRGRPVGAVLLTRGAGRRRAGVPIRTLHIGTAGGPPRRGVHVPYNRLLAAPGEREAVAAALVERLLDDRRWDELRLENLHPADAAAIAAAAPWLERSAEPSYALCVREARGGDVIRLLGRSTRRDVRQALRNCDAPTAEISSCAEEAHGMLDELIGLHQARWRRAGLPGVFADPRFTAFHRELIDVLAPEGRAILARVRDRRRTLGCLLVYCEGDRALSYQSGIAAPVSQTDRPGYVAHALTARALAARGFREYDYLAGHAQYKRQLSNLVHEQVTLRARRARPWLMPVDAARAVRRAVTAW
jgi:CelD/BcsL family acetyltransferase involved in cellulose biosynthesis